MTHGFDVVTLPVASATSQREAGNDTTLPISSETWYGCAQLIDPTGRRAAEWAAGPAWARAVLELTRSALAAKARAAAAIEVIATRVLVRAQPNRPIDVGTDIWSVGVGVGCFALISRSHCFGGDVRLWRSDEDFPIWRDELSPGQGVVFDTETVDFDLSPITATDEGAHEQFVLAFARPVPSASGMRTALSGALSRCRFEIPQRR